jgi:phage anti-repressor protein
MNKLIPSTVNFNELVKNSNTTLSLNLKSKLVDTLNTEFTNEEQQWYIANLYIYMNYHPINDYPINLENVFSMIGFANKGNAMKTIKNNFTKDEDYKIIIFRTEKNLNSKDLGGRPTETVMLNVDTFKNLCMLTKTDKGKEIRRYYVKLENIYNKLIQEEIEEKERLLQAKRDELVEKDFELKNMNDTINKQEKALTKEKTWRNKILNRRCSDVEVGNCVYVFQDNLDDPNSLKKIGQTKDLKTREQFYSNLNKSGGIVYYKKCIDCSLIEKMCHHILGKFRTNKMQEWFDIDINIAKSTIDTVIKLFDDRENVVTNIQSIQTIFNFNQANYDNLDDKATDNNTKATDIVDKLDDIKNPMDFDQFIKDCCEISSEYNTPKSDLKLAHRIWCKSSTKEIVKKLDDYLKTNFKSGVIVQNDIKRNVYKQIRLKELQYDPDMDNLVDFEQFILENCNIGWMERVSYVDFFTEFVKWKINVDTKYTLTTEYKRKIQAYLEKHFAGGRVHLSNKMKTTHLHGIWGLGIKSTGSGLKTPKRTCKSVEQYDQTTHILVKSWESLSIASRELNIPVSTLSNYCRFGTITNNYIYKYRN